MLKEIVIGSLLLTSPPDSTLEQRLIERGYNEERVERVFSDYTQQRQVIQLFSHNPEKQSQEEEITYEEYKENFDFEYRQYLLRNFVEEYRETLQETEERFGVDYRYIAGIIGVETGFGSYTGSFQVNDVYKTVHENVERRREFALEQAECLMEIVEDGKIAFEMRGSYAGALGHGQFIPCSVRDYFKGDIDSMEDTIYSVANYLRNNKKEHPNKEGYTQWDPSKNNEPISLGEGNYFSIWAYNHSPVYVRLVDELARTVER